MLSNTSFEYEKINDSLKEIIKLSKKPEKEESYSFELDTKGLQCSLKDDGAVYINKGNETKFIIPAPFMNDSNNDFSEDIKVDLEKKSDKYILTYTPDFKWLSDIDREYPVYIDPTITLSDSDNVDDAYVYSKQPDTNFGDASQLKTGKIYTDPNNKEEYQFEYLSFIKFNNLPENIWNNSYITKAKLNLSTMQQYDTIYYMHEVESSWDESTITYNNMPKYNSNSIIEYKNLSKEFEYDEEDEKNNEYDNWDITNLVEKWYSNPESNYGVMLETYNTMPSYSGIFSSELKKHPYGNNPYLTIEFTSLTNSAYSNSRDINIGRAGNVNVNDFDGNVRLTRNDIGVDGNIMPVNISMIYDKNNLNLPTDINTNDYGKGFRTNYSQRLIYDADKEIYTYIGEDSRSIYFEKSEDDNGNIVFVDKSDRGYELFVSGDDYAKYGNISITDENNYKYIFDSLGRLIKIADMNLSGVKEANVSSSSTDNINGVIKISYTTNNSFSISQITDGVGRKYQFNYDGQLTSISYKGTGNEALKTVSYTYNSNGTLAKVTFPDNKNVSYEWDNFALSKVINTDGYSFAFTYTNENLPRIKTINEYGSDGKLGEDVSVSYSVGKTIYTDNKSNKQEILQFDKYGNLLTSQDSNNYVLVNQYGNSKLNSQSNSPNELINSFGYQKNEINLLSNSRANYGTDNWNGITISSDEKMFGDKSFKLTGKSSNAYQTVNLVKDEIYVLSSYVKTKNVKGATGATVKISDGDITINSDAQYVTGSSKWTRVATTFKANSNCSANVSLVLDNTNTLAEAYFDGIQLEKGTTVSEYNFVENSDFENNSNWDSSSINANAAPTLQSDKSSYFMANEDTPFDKNCIKLFGDPRYENNIYQEITNINGQKGDSYNFGGWAKAGAAAIKEDRTFGLKIEFYNGADLVGEPTTLSFNSYINDWQYNMSSATASDVYNKIRIYAIYDNQINYALFDRLQVQYTGVSDVEEESENSDTEEDSVSDESEEDKSIKDEHGRVIEDTDEDGVKTLTGYDNFDNVTRSATQINGKILESKQGYTSDGNYQTSDTNALGNTTTYDYDTQLGLLNKVTDAEGYNTSYSYDNQGNITKVNNSGAYLTYGYNNGDRLSKINNSPYFSYNIAYDQFGALKSIALGSQSLVEYSYNDDYILSKAQYANGQSVDYNYDEKGNKLGISSDGNEKFSYYYDDFGNLLSVKDNVNNTVTSYSKDEDDIEYTQERKNNKLVHSYYNNDSVFTEYANGSEKQTIYSSKISSDNDATPLINWNRTSWKKNGFNTYYNVKDTKDEFGRASVNEIFEANLSEDKQTESNKDLLIKKSYEYTSTNNGVNQSEQVSKIKYEGVYEDTINYDYDNNGNIISDGKYEYEYNDENKLVCATDINTGNYVDYRYTEYNGLYEIIYFDANGKRLARNYYSYAGNRISKFNGTPITYDALGNPLTYYNGTQFTWEMGRQLATATLSDGTAISYKYNADGLRTEKKVGDKVTSYTLVGSKITGQTDGTNTFYFRYDESDNLLGFELGGEQYFYITNLVGDIVAIVDSNGETLVKYEYDPWGKCTIVSDISENNLGTLNPFRYRGYYYDEETSFYYLQSRYYDFNTCKFINADDPSILLVDPYNVQCVHIYDYCNNNPVIFVDYSGKFSYVYSYKGQVSFYGYYERPVLTNKIYFNCYAYALGISYVSNTSKFYPGYKKFKFDYNKRYVSVEEVAKRVQSDLKALGRKVKIVNNKYKAKKGEYLIAMRVTKKEKIYNPYRYDFHFMKKVGNGAWRFKAGWDGPIMQLTKGRNPSQVRWDAYYGRIDRYRNCVYGVLIPNYYTSKIIYIAVTY